MGPDSFAILSRAISFRRIVSQCRKADSRLRKGPDAQPRRRARHQRYVRNNYIVTNGTLVTPTDKWSVKGDQMLGSKQRFSFLWNMHNVSQQARC